MRTDWKSPTVSSQIPDANWSATDNIFAKDGVTATHPTNVTPTQRWIVGKGLGFSGADILDLATVTKIHVRAFGVGFGGHRAGYSLDGLTFKGSSSNINWTNNDNRHHVYEFNPAGTLTAEEVRTATFGVLLSPVTTFGQTSLDHLEIALEWDDRAQGVEYYAVIRTAPDNGPDESFDLVALFPDSMGPVVVTPGYDEIQDRRETISHRVNVQPRGYRPTCRLKFQIHDMARDHGTLATILSRLMDREWRVYLSLDGGKGEREVVLAKNKGPKVLTKQGVGAEFVLDLDAVDTVLELPNLRRVTPDDGGSW